MPQRQYDDLVDKFPTAHLVVATVDALGSLTAATRLLTKLIAALGAAGDYGLANMQEEPGFAVHCLFERKADADRLAAAVQAKSVDHYANWASQRAFRLNLAARTAIAAVLAERGTRQGCGPGAIS